MRCDCNHNFVALGNFLGPLRFKRAVSAPIEISVLRKVVELVGGTFEAGSDVVSTIIGGLAIRSACAGLSTTRALGRFSNLQVARCADRSTIMVNIKPIAISFDAVVNDWDVRWLGGTLSSWLFGVKFRRSCRSGCQCSLPRRLVW